MVVTRWNMNLDMNAISMLMQMMQKNGDAKPPQKPQEAQNTHMQARDDKSIGKSAFTLQNGIGEQIRLDFSGNSEPNDPKTDFIKSLPSQNPMLALLSGMQGGKADISSMLPLFMSLMQKPKPESHRETAQSANCACSEQPANEKSEIAKNSADTAAIANKKETQRGIFSPFAFAGYEVISSLYSLLKASRRPCR